MSANFKLNPQGTSILTNLKVKGSHLLEKEFTAAGAISPETSFVTLNNASSAIAMTIAAPAAGKILVIAQKDAGTQGHTVTLTAGTFDGTNDTATFNAQDECLVLIGLSATRFAIVENVGGVALS